MSADRLRSLQPLACFIFWIHSKGDTWKFGPASHIHKVLRGTEQALISRSFQKTQPGWSYVYLMRLTRHARAGASTLPSRQTRCGIVTYPRFGLDRHTGFACMARINPTSGIGSTLTNCSLIHTPRLSREQYVGAMPCLVTPSAIPMRICR